ncbi:formyltransferase family protein [Opitutales bacterium]|nr:formyltransferase family protein [Opitutales bacterium]
MPKKKIAFLGSKKIGLQCLKHLIEKGPELGCEIVCVLSNNRILESSCNETLTSLASLSGIPFLDDLDELLELDDIDLIISVQYHRILSEKHLLKAKEMSVNLHMAPLPEYRGCNQFSFAILNQEEEFGTTLHEMRNGIDDGPILAQRRFKIPDNCFVDELYNLTFNESIALFKESVPSLVSGKLAPVEQDQINAIRREIHYRSEIDEIKKIEACWSTEKIIRHIRATAMPSFPPPFMKVGNKKINFSVEDA